MQNKRKAFGWAAFTFAIVIVAFMFFVPLSVNTPVETDIIISIVVAFGLAVPVYFINS